MTGTDGSLGSVLIAVKEGSAGEQPALQIRTARANPKAEVMSTKANSRGVAIAQAFVFLCSVSDCLKVILLASQTQLYTFRAQKSRHFPIG
jgi:hypothetical protein